MVCRCRYLTSVSVFGIFVGIFLRRFGIRYRYLKYRDIGIGIRYFAIVYNFWSNKATAGPPGIPVLKTQNPPRQRKISRKFPFGKMLDFASSKTISTQTSNIYWNQLQWHGQFAEVYMQVLSLEIIPQRHQQLSTRPTCREWPAAIDHRCPNKHPLPEQTPPGHCLSLEHLSSQADECKTLACDLSDLISF